MDIEKTRRYAKMMLKIRVCRLWRMPATLPATTPPHRIGVDLGGTKTEIVVLDTQHRCWWRERTATPSDSYAAIVETVVQLVAQARHRFDLPHDVPVGIGIPGCIDTRTQRVRGANTQVLNGQPLQIDVQQRLGCRVEVANDANCLALSEAVDGAAAGAGLTFAAILGTGCGAGLALGTRVWTGRHALAGEWGHNPLPWPSAQELDIEPCWCGQTGCLEGWLSGPGFAADHARVTGQRCSPEAIVAAMRSGDANARASFLRYTDRLARGLAHIINVLDPEVIVLGGGMSRVDEIYTQVPALLSRHTFTRPIDTPLRPARHGDSSGVRGAAWLCWDPI